MKIIKNPKITLPLFIFIILLAIAAWYFIQSKNDKQDKAGENDSLKTSSRIQVENGVTTIDLSPSEQTNSGITTTELIQTLHQAQLAAYGSVVSIQDLAKDVQSFEADKARLAKSKENLLISQKNFERLKSLYEKNLASEQDYQSAQAAFLSDKADMNSVQTNLNSLKSTIVEQWGNEISNWIFSGSSSLQNLLYLKEELIQISLPPDEIDIKIPNNIFIQPSSGTSGRISCRFVSAGHLANSQFQTKTLYYITSGALLGGGMNVKAFLPVGKNLNGVIVPSESIVWYQGKAWIYAEQLPNKFIRVEVDTDNPVDNGFFIPGTKGIINSGVTVVKNGAQLLLSEELAPAQGSQSSRGDND
ncbi:MAG: hypothetical protein M1495_09765 [Bacteroidetes bacterium]|nr:hypothetical protein [Bacteroidota bacterium]